MSWIALCYHDVLPTLPGSGGGPQHFTTSLTGFECMLDTIRQQGLIGCSLLEAWQDPSNKRVAITFDDGDKGQFVYAVPALVERGMTATFYITTEWVGRSGYVSWSDLHEMVAAGMSIQSHTRSHPFLSELSAAALVSELTDSKRTLEDKLGVEVREIAFPGGDAPARRLRGLIAESGYDIAVGTRWGKNTGRSEQTVQVPLRRCTVRGHTSRAAAERVLTGDRWLGLKTNAKEVTLRRLRSSLGASRYARVRRAFLDFLPGGV
jgi:peptidoglycan/xylan/chitin deacetylase (PgdA/CDA1 family)